MIITKDIWNDVLDVLKKHKISYTTHYESRDIPGAMECPDITVSDKHFQINLVVPDWWEESREINRED